MFGISGFELLIIAVFVMIIFGPDKLPELAKQFGKFMKMFRKTQDDMEKLIRAEMYPSLLKDESSDAEKTETAEVKEAATRSAQEAWSSTEEDDEEEDEE